MPLFTYRCPKTRYRVQGFAAEDISEDHHIYEPVTCPVCHQVHHVNPATGAILGEKVEQGSGCVAQSCELVITGVTSEVLLTAGGFMPSCPLSKQGLGGTAAEHACIGDVLPVGRFDPVPLDFLKKRITLFAPDQIIP